MHSGMTKAQVRHEALHCTDRIRVLFAVVAAIVVVVVVVLAAVVVVVTFDVVVAVGTVVARCCFRHISVDVAVGVCWCWYWWRWFVCVSHHSSVKNYVTGHPPFTKPLFCHS